MILLKIRYLSTLVYGCGFLYLYCLDEIFISLRMLEYHKIFFWGEVLWNWKRKDASQSDGWLKINSRVIHVKKLKMGDGWLKINRRVTKKLKMSALDKVIYSWSPSTSLNSNAFYMYKHCSLLGYTM